jgi:hypothetical protein
MLGLLECASCCVVLQELVFTLANVRRCTYAIDACVSTVRNADTAIRRILSVTRITRAGIWEHTLAV